MPSEDTSSVVSVVLIAKIREFMPYAQPGTRIIVHVLDDKQFQDAVWNSILQTKINFNVSSGVVANSLVRLDKQCR